MKRLNVLSYICLVGILTFGLASCEKESQITTEAFVLESVKSIDSEAKTGIHGCAEFVFPITIEFVDGTQAEVESYDELKGTIRTFKEENPDLRAKPKLVFPIELITEDGDVISVTSREEMRQVLKHCRMNNGGQGKKCFKLVFPVSINYPDGKSEEYATKMELKQALRQWKQDNPNVDERPILDFPLDVIFRDGTTQTVESKEALMALKEECKD